MGGMAPSAHGVRLTKAAVHHHSFLLEVENQEGPVIHDTDRHEQFIVESRVPAWLKLKCPPPPFLKHDVQVVRRPQVLIALNNANPLGISQIRLDTFQTAKNGVLVQPCARGNLLERLPLVHLHVGRLQFRAISHIQQIHSRRVDDE